MRQLPLRTCLFTATALSSLVYSNAALADCVAGAGALSNLVTCDSPGGVGTNGYATTNNGVTIQVLSTATVNTPPPSTPTLLSAGTGSVLNNFSGAFNNGSVSFGIDAGSFSNPAISLGGGSTVNNTSNAAMQGAVSFGSATGSAVNTFNNSYSVSGGAADIEGNITSIGNTVINNQGYINYVGWSTITQTGAGGVTINNGDASGFGSTIWADINTVGSTTLNNLAGAFIYANPGGTQTIQLGTGGTGTTTVNNAGGIGGNLTLSDATNVFNNTATGSQFNGNVVMNGGTNTVTNDGLIGGSVTMNGTVRNTYNAGSTGSAGDNGLRLPGNGAGTLTGLAATSANNTLNLNGTGASVLQSAAVIQNFGVVNKNDSGSWLLHATLDGAAGKLTTLNLVGGTLSTDSAAFLGSAATTVSLANGTTLTFNGAAAGTFAGNLVNASGATTGNVIVSGANATTLAGTNTYSGTTTIDGGTLVTGSNGALSANSDFTIQNGGTLTINHQVALKSLSDAGTGPNTVNLNGSATSLTLTGGTWGAAGGTVTGSGTLIKNGSAALTLGGTGAVNLAAPGTFQINNGAVNVNAADAIGATTAVQVNSTSTTTGVLNVNQNDTIGSLAGTGANAQVNIASGMTLTTGGLNSTTSYAGHIAGAGALVKNGTGLMTLTGANNYTGGTTVNGGAIIGFVGTGASITGDYTLNNGSFLTFNQLLPAGGPQSGTYAGNVTGASTAYMQFGANSTTKVTLTGNNSGFAGTSTFGFGSGTIGQGGTVAIGSATNIGTGTLQFYDGVLENTASLALANAVSLQTTGGGGTFNTDAGTTLTLNGSVSGGGALLKVGTGTLILGGSNNYSGGTTVTAGVLQGVAGVGLQGNIVDNALVNFTGNQNTYSGDLSGTGSVGVINNALIAFTGTNTNSGTTTIAAGSELIGFGTTGALSANSTFVVNGILDGWDQAQTIGGLAGSGLLVTNGQVFNIGGNNASTTFSGVIGNGGYSASNGCNCGSATINKTGTGTLTLSGTGSTLTGNLGVGAGTLSLTGTLASATTSVASGAVLSVDGTLTSPTVTIASGGRLVGGVGTVPGNIVGAVTNSGTVAPGHSPGIIAISGSYTQTATGTYAADVYGNGTSTVVAGVDYDRIAVSGTPGTASLAGTLAVTQNGGLYVAGTVYDIITTTGGITGNFSSISGNVISPFITLSNTAANGGGVVGTSYRLVVVRSAYSAVATNPNQVAVATGLQGLVGATGTAATVTKIDNMTAAQAQALFNTTSPEPYGAYATALQDQGELFTRQVDTRIGEASNADKTGLWVNGYGQWGNGKNRDFRFGSDQRTYGIAGGVDFDVSGLRLGIATGYSEDKVTYLQGNSSGKSKSWQVGGYVAYAMDKLHLDAQVAYVSGDITATKLVAAGAGSTLISGTASASTKGHLFKGIATVGYDLGTDKIALRPYVGVDFASGHINGFTETGMGVLDLTVDQITAERTDVVAGAKFSAPMGSITPYVNVAYRYRVNDSDRSVRAYFDGLSGSAFSVSAINSGRSRIDVDAGITAKLGSTAALFLGYQGTFRNDVDSHGVNGGFRFAF